MTREYRQGRPACRSSPSVLIRQTENKKERVGEIPDGSTLQLTLSSKTMVWRLQCGMIPALRAAWPSKESQTNGQMRVPDHNIQDIAFSSLFGPVGLRHLLPFREFAVAQVSGWLEHAGLSHHAGHSDAEGRAGLASLQADCQQVVPSSGNDLSGAVWSLGSLVGPVPPVTWAQLASPIRPVAPKKPLWAHCLTWHHPRPALRRQPAPRQPLASHPPYLRGYRGVRQPEQPSRSL